MTAPRKMFTLSEPMAAASLLVLGTACAALLFALPRPVAPLELPSLSLPAAAVDAQLREDAEQARTLPKGAHAKGLEALLWKHGAAEARGIEDADTYRNRRKALEVGYRMLAAEVGKAEALRLRSRAVEQLEAALDLRLPIEQGKAVLGALTSVLERDGASRNGYLVAPRFVVRTLYKARWNILHGLAPDDSFARVEKRAFYGWQSLHAVSVPLPRRIEALHAYAEAGGEQVEEALGVLLFRQGDYAQSVTALQAAYRKQGSLRLRNYLLGARAAARYQD